MKEKNFLELNICLLRLLNTTAGFPEKHCLWSVTLKAFTYNYLGATKSHGCIRLTTADSRWIYEHCALGTSITVYESPIPGPFDRPVIKTMIPDTQTYDPTDANVPENGLQ